MKPILSVLLFVIVNLAYANGNNTIAVQPITEQVTLLKSSDSSTNIGLIKTPQGLVLIDPMPGNEHFSRLHNTIQSLDNSQTPVRYVLNTHGHSDHIGGNAFFERLGAVVNQPNASIILYEMRSHSSDDFVYYVPQSNVVFVGDVFDTSWHPTFYVGGVKGFTKAIDKILNIGDEQTIIVPGHGRIADKAQLRAFKKNTLAWIDRVKTLHTAGRTTSNIANDPQILALIEKFNYDKQKQFLPEKAFHRFIKRTVSVIDNDKKL
ncbi:MBL fold metallo-hydrolase [Pseudoalteromonas sp. S16_S37]|uniref:MBL fold metallo-hydrolase n=1 Tax=Pseudoalteromonas sp. S16_S37 TaxID=2720228 RepID=UPI001680B4F3|nr:MBL fold metallo-hydrolase [Pseudoalteromonas sp. S16_S37]MBD1583092.1 MBL fold metallo-hydrolase [Pseudoalteromonas sp. S16_S37]